MITLLHIIHIAVCVGLIVIVLFQADKGEGLSAFGGGASTIFGERGGGGFMSKLTTIMAIVFMLTSLIIAVFVPNGKNTVVNYSAPISAL